MQKLVIAWLTIVSFSCAMGQATIKILVKNEENRKPIEAQTIVLQNEANGIEKSNITNSQGLVVFSNLQALQNYKIIAVESPAYESRIIQNIDLRSNEEYFLDLYLRPNGVVDLDEIVVTSETSQAINRQNAEVAFELEEKEIRAIPVEGRDITRVLYRLPNVSQATGFYPEAPNVSINGANPLFTSYMIDGMDNNERFLGGQKFAVPVGFTKDVTVLTNNYSAEYGLTSNGVINITTKSGSNDFSGEAFFITRPGEVIDGQSDFPQRDLSGNFVKQGFQRYQAGFGFGGAIVPNQTFYYINVEQTIDLKQNILSSPDLGVSEEVNGRNNFTYLSAKVDHYWSDRFRSSLRVNQGFVNIENPGGGLEGGVTFPSAGLTQDRISTQIALKNTYNFNRLSIQTNLQYSRFNWDYGEPIGDINSPQVIVRNPNDITIGVLGHPGFVFDEIENTFQWQQKFSYAVGRHALKFGGGIISADHILNGGSNPNGNWVVRLNESQLDQVQNLNKGADLSISDIPTSAEVVNYGVELRPNAFGTRQTIYSVYLEDQWSATDRLNLTLGLRYDYDNLSKGGSDEGDFNNLAPRLNLNYKLGDKSVIRAGYGLFYDKIIYAIYSDALQQNTNSEAYKTQLQSFIDQGILPADTDIDAVTFEGNLVASTSNIDFLNPPSTTELQAQRGEVFSAERRILNPNGYDNPYTHQFSLGYQYQINDDQLFFVDLMYNRSYNLFRLRNLNAAEAYPLNDPDEVIIRAPEVADASRPVPILYDNNGSPYGLINGERVSGVARNVMMTETAGESEYIAASFNFQKARGEDDWSLRVNYTLSQLRNNTEDINFRSMDANDFEAEWGPSINDRTHIMNGIFTYYPIKNLEITLAAIIQSGQPVNRVPGNLFGPTADLNGDGASFGDAYVGNSDRYPGESRNNDRLPWSNTFDLGMNYQIPLGDQSIEFRADIFNVFNTQNWSGYSNNATQSNQIQVGSRASGQFVRRNASAPRQFQFTIRYLW